MKKELVVVLDNIRSSHNVGSIFRTSECVGVEEIILCGITPLPIDKFGIVNKEIEKVALGADKIISYKYFKTTAQAINALKKNGYKVIALEQSPKSIDYKKIKLGKKSALILGTEVTGIPKSILLKCDEIAEIEMVGKKESLNVSVAFGVAVFRLMGI